MLVTDRSDDLSFVVGIALEEQSLQLRTCSVLIAPVMVCWLVQHSKT